MSGAGHQTLRVLDGSYVFDRRADATGAIPSADVLAVAFGPDGSTVMRRDDTGEDAWSALWNGDEAHDVQATCEWGVSTHRNTYPGRVGGCRGRA
jgi:hypothetical protein